MMHRSLALGLAVLASATLEVSLPAQSRSGEGSPRTRDIYVSVLDSKGAPVPGLSAGDFVVREDGAAREVLKAGPATAPMQIIVLIDDSEAATNAVQRIREGMTAFLDKLQGRAEIGLVTIGERPTSLVEHTTDTAALKKAVNRLFARPGAGAYLLEGIDEVSRGLEKRQAARAVIVAVTTEGVEFSNLQHEQVLKRLEASGAALHVIAIGMPSGSMSDEMRNRNQVLAEGTERTGGRRDQLLAESSIKEALPRLAEELLNQYVVTYSRPETLIPPEKVQVSVSRPGVTVRARTRAGGR
jgi:VWFA-related protein